MIRWSALLLALVLSFSQEARADRVEVSTAPACQADAGHDFVATPLPAACIVAVKLPSLHPGLTGIEGAPPPLVRDVPPQSRIERQTVLVSAQEFEQYRAFRESLSTP